MVPSTTVGRPRAWIVPVVLLLSVAVLGDEIELVSGKRHQGELVKETAERITFKVHRGGGSATMTFPVEKVRAITVAGQRRELVGAGAAPAAGGTMRSRAEVEALIAGAGSTPPDWWDSTPLEYPKTLDLTWTKPTGPWNPQRNLGQYLFSVIDANPNKGPSGARLLHHTLTVNKDRPDKLKQSMLQLGHVYVDVLEDYARGAFWLRKAEGMGGSLQLNWQVKLALCYWKLGSKQMAAEVLSRHRVVNPAVIKLWSDMGELQKAVSLAEVLARRYPDLGSLAAADAYRLHGRYREAEAHYQQVLSLNQGSGALKRNKERARANLQALKAFEALDLTRVPDGTYRSSSRGYKGSITVGVTVRNSRIESVDIASHQENRALSALVAVPARIVEKQGVKGVDAVTGATITSEAVLNATAEALAAAMK